MKNYYDEYRYILSQLTDDEFIKSQAEQIFKFYESMNLTPDYPVANNNSMKFIIKKEGMKNLAHATLGKDFLNFSHLDEPLIIKISVLKNKDNPFYTKSTSVTYKDPQSDLINPKYSYIMQTVETFDAGGQKFFEQTTRKSNKNGIYKNSTSEFDSNSKLISYLERDINTYDYRMINLLEHNGDETLLVIPMGESEEKSLPVIQLSQLQSNSPITNFESIYQSYFNEISKYESKDDELIEKSKRRADMFANLHIESEKQNSYDLYNKYCK